MRGGSHGGRAAPQVGDDIDRARVRLAHAGTVVGGSAATINQSSQSAIINWATFNIGRGETAAFNQPNSTAVTLNRVIGGRGPFELIKGSRRD
jgi:large exoprotein involved in heme utilization and adhesion